MKNKEKYINDVISYASRSRASFGVRLSGDIFTCYENDLDNCSNCIFYNDGEVCRISRRRWLEKEYHEPHWLSKEEKTLLDMLNPRWIAMARNADDSLCLYDLQDAYHLEKVGCNWESNNGFDCYVGLLNYLIDNSYFQMVKWEDDKPWLIADLKKLSVRENE